jgi:hypothetical protein
VGIDFHEELFNTDAPELASHQLAQRCRPGVSAKLLYGFGHIILQNPSHQHTTGAIFSYARLSMSVMMPGDAAPRFRVSAQNALR